MKLPIYQSIIPNNRTKILNDINNGRGKRSRKIACITNEEGCFLCISHAQDKDGYVKLTVNGKHKMLHHYVYEVVHGENNGVIIRHTCNNRNCINPEHLQATTDSHRLSPNAKKIDFEIDDNGCFNCTSHKPNNSGYRSIKIKSKSVLMHRYVYEQCFGDIPEGLVIRHKCDNRNCINPEHLETGTIADNINDMMTRGGHVAPKGDENGSAKLEFIEAYEAYKMMHDGEKIKDLSKQYKMSTSALSRIKNGKSWASVNNRFRVFYDIEKERDWQEVMRPKKLSILERMPVLIEEIGEIGTAIQNNDKENLYEELIQSAAVAIRMAEEVLDNHDGSNKNN